MTTDLRFDCECLPFCYNRERWSNEQPAGGYTTASSAPLPSEVLSSLVMTWNLHNPGSRVISFSVSDPEWTSRGESSNLVERLVRSALAVVSREDYEAGLGYLINLLRAGYIIDTQPLVNALSILLVARSQADSDIDMISRFYGGVLPNCNEEGINLGIHYEWLKIKSLSFDWMEFRSLVETVNFLIDHSKIEPYMVGLLEATLARVDFVRGADKFDDWVTGQVTLGGEIKVVTTVIAGLAKSVPLAMRAVISQLEEIHADVGAITSSLRSQYGIPSYYADESWGFVKHVAGEYRRTLGADWADRFFTERLLIPYDLRSTLLPDLVISGKSVEWDELSWLVAQPFCLALRDQEPVVVMSKASDTSVRLERLSEPVVPSFVSRTAGLDLGALDIVATEGGGQRSSVPSAVRAVSGMLLRDSSDRSPWMSLLVDALDPKQVQAQDGAALRPRDDVAVLVNKYKTHCFQEVMAGIELAMQKDQAGRREEAIETLDRLRELYPWNAVVYQELSIATDENGDPNAALEFMVRALVLDPRQSMPWQSLSVILRRLNAHEESRIARAVSMATKQSKAWMH